MPILLHIEMAFSDVLDLVEAVFHQKFLKRAKCNTLLVLFFKDTKILNEVF